MSGAASKIPSDLSMVWKELQVAWKEALDVWVIGSDGAPVAAIAERTVRRLMLFELDALIRHLSVKMAESVYVQLVAGYANFWEIWTIAAILEQGRRLSQWAEISKTATPPEH
jgi:hypothetical protein